MFYSLVPADANSLDTVPYIMEFKPDMNVYVIKSLSVNRIYKEQYQSLKGARAYREEIIQSQNLAPVHFNPDNILKRMNFKWAELEKSEKDKDLSPDPKEPS